MNPLTQENLSSLLTEVAFNADGLVPVIAQQYNTGEVLMMAWMNRESLEETLRTKRMCYWSRSRQSFWRKGDTSGHTQTLKALYLDCDGDTLLAKIDQVGAACHTGRHSCFFREECASAGTWRAMEEIFPPPEDGLEDA